MNLESFLATVPREEHVRIACKDGGGWIVIGAPDKISLTAIDNYYRDYNTDRRMRLEWKITTKTAQMKKMKEFMRRSPEKTEEEVIREYYEKQCREACRIKRNTNADLYVQRNTLKALSQSITNLKQKLAFLNKVDTSEIGKREVVETYNIKPTESPLTVCIKITGTYLGDYWDYQEQEKDGWRFLNEI